MTPGANARKTHGLTGKPIEATRLLMKDTSQQFNRNPMQCHVLLALNSTTGKVTSVNAYKKDGGWFCGRNYDATQMTFAISAEKVTEWEKTHKEVNIADYNPIIIPAQIKAEVAEVK